MTESSERPEWLDWAQNEHDVARLLREQDPEWFMHVCELLHEHDPMPIQLVPDADGFAAEAGTVIRNLPQCQSVADVQELLYNTFVHWFTEEFAGARCQYQDAALAVWQAWLARNHDYH
ncbi:hypothetical protein ACTSKR_03065 [Chitinibacteraceae bacterium HSL-7]